MKKTTLFILILFVIQFLISCSVSRELKQERKDWNYNNWDKEFKSRAFCLCQLKGYENKNLEKQLTENDNSYFSALGIAIFDDKLEQQINKEVETIRLDSIRSDGSYPEDLKSLYQKRNVINHCLEFYNSKRLDSLTNLQKKYWKNIPSIINKVQEKIPTY